MACAEAWRGDGATLASPMGVIPSLGARLARLTFAPELLLTDGEAYLVDADGQVEGWLPYAKVFTMLAAGRRHVMMGAAQIDRYGNQNISVIGDWRRPKAQLLGVRGAPGNTVNHPVSYWVPRHSPRVFTAHVDMVCGVGYDRGACELRVVVTNLAVLDFALNSEGTAERVMRLRSVHPGVEVADVLAATGFPLAVPDQVPVTRLPTPAELDLIRTRLDPGRGAGPGAGMSEPEASGKGAVRTPLTDLLGIRYPVVQAAMGYVSGPRLAAAVSDAGGLGLIASATMSLAELEKAIEDTAGRTPRPFGVNLRADAADAAERVRLIVTRRVPVASFAQAPKPELIAALKDAGVVTIASVGARRHAEKAAGWGIDAVIATGAEGGGHVGAVPTSLLVPQVAAAVDIPVIAAGGFFDGRGLVAALAWGAAGIAMGTRFLLTSDSPVAERGQAGLPGRGPGRHGGDPAGRRGAAPRAAHDDGRPARARGARGARGWRGEVVERAAAGGGAGAVGAERRGVPGGVRDGVAGDAAAGPGDAAGRAGVGAGADGGEHPGAAPRGHGGRPDRPRADVVRAGDRADRRPAVVRGADRGDHGRGRRAPWTGWKGSGRREARPVRAKDVR